MAAKSLLINISLLLLRLTLGFNLIYRSILFVTAAGWQMPTVSFVVICMLLTGGILFGLGKFTRFVGLIIGLYFVIEFSTYGLPGGSYFEIAAPLILCAAGAGKYSLDYTRRYTDQNQTNKLAQSPS
jgi:hypothetical protein